jgi:hypothetical protein
MGALRMAMPLVHRLLPLLDGNIGSAVSHLLTPPAPTPPLPVPVDLEPVEEGLAQLQDGLIRLQDENRALHTQMQEQSFALKRVEEQLALQLEATERISLAQKLAQKETAEELKAIRRKMRWLAWIGLSLLTICVALDAVVLLHLFHLLPH